MPEAAAIFLVGIICVGIFVYALVQAMSPANRDVEVDAKTLEREIVWLEERRALANREEWQSDMTDAIEERLTETRRRHAFLKSKY